MPAGEWLLRGVDGRYMCTRTFTYHVFNSLHIVAVKKFLTGKWIIAGGRTCVLVVCMAE